LNIIFEVQSNGQFPFENNFKRTKNCPVTRVNTNEPSTQRTNWYYLCSVMYLTQQSTSSHDNISFIVT